MRNKILSLSKNEDFKSLLNGKKISNKYLTIFFRKLNNKNSNKLNISFVTKKKIGNAVSRNKIKRRLRNIMQEALKKIKINFCYSYLLIAKKNVLEDSYENIKKVLFVEEGSTSGYLYPSLQLKNMGIDYKSDITQVFAGSHDGVISGLYNGDAKFGVTYDDARRTLRKTNPDVGEKVIAIGISAEIPNDVVAVRSDLPEDIKSKIYQILSDYMATDEGAAVMDEIYGWTDVVPADNSEFDVVKQAAEEFGLYDE